MFTFKKIKVQSDKINYYYHYKAYKFQVRWTIFQFCINWTVYNLFNLKYISDNNAVTSYYDVKIVDMNLEYNSLF